MRWTWLLVPAWALSVALAPCAYASDPAGDAGGNSALQSTLTRLTERARPGLLGVTVLDLRSGASWHVHGDHAFPMMSVFKAPVAAAVLARIERGEVAPEQKVTIHRAQLQTGPIRDNFHGETMPFTVCELLAAAVSRSDNTAADALVRIAGGPAAVTRFLRVHGITGMRVDLDEAGVGRVFEAGPASRETPEQEDRRLRRGYRAFLADPRNRSTPDAAAVFLRKLWRGQLLSPDSTAQLLDLMGAQLTPRRLRAGLPPGLRLADKCGTSYTLDGLTAAFNDIGIVSWPDGHAVIVAAFLSASPGSQREREALYADLARAVVQTVHPQDAPSP